MIDINRSDHISLDEAIKLLTSENIILAQGEDDYRAALKILYKMLGVTSRKTKNEKGKDPFEAIVRSMKGILHV